MSFRSGNNLFYLLCCILGATAGCAIQSKDDLLRMYISAYNRNASVEAQACFEENSLRRLQQVAPVLVKAYTVKPFGGIGSGIPHDTKITWSKIDPYELQVMKRDEIFVIDPTHKVEIAFTDSVRSMVAVRTNGKWKFVAPVPTEESLRENKSWLYLLESVYNQSGEGTP